MNNAGQLFEEPLLVLRYRRGNVFATTLLFSIPSILCFGCLLAVLKDFPSIMSLLGIVSIAFSNSGPNPLGNVRYFS